MKLMHSVSATTVAFILIAFSNACAVCNSNGTDSFMLQASSDDVRFNGLVVEGEAKHQAISSLSNSAIPAFHTMPLPQTDLTLGHNKYSAPVRFVFNGTYLASTIYGYDSTTSCPLVGVQMSDPAFYYSSWLPASLTSTATQGFYMDMENGLMSGLYDGVEFTGWMACFWSHQGQPQLFNVGPTPDKSQLYVPSNCGMVKLVMA
ncbi:hypothetical protein K490DRAFT_62926 [Saccharata proteae CBS 121410]|uniref:DUF7907 domain-containing protein n=1 Tax=Saccharata proteae CBS 121410 TaxID=1314787 RepID=A0A9P4HZ17_9PEZI|nr:hypothetical protein K490DRAFT_62926 [Saccharata proteae CBS 121410]